MILRIDRCSSMILRVLRDRSGAALLPAQLMELLHIVLL